MLSFHEQGNTLIPIENGVPLCSLRAREEGRTWVQKQEISASQAVIIGLGAGHHVIAWLQANPESYAVVIDTRSALIGPFKAQLGEFKDRVDVVIVDSIDGLSRHEVMDFIVAEMPPVLLFRPAMGSQRALLENLFRFCTGRSVDGLRRYLNAFGFESEGAIGLSDDGRFLTVKDLGVIVDTSHAGHPQAPLVRVLKELVV
ncbi:MAG TPA: hypothetical protein PL182_03285 [Pseudobdellovibrionaceae bacterium]|nr:hypothetical protein [Pseudobdellovibrionaceae bacterium]